MFFLFLFLFIRIVHKMQKKRNCENKSQKIEKTYCKILTNMVRCERNSHIGGCL